MINIIGGIYKGTKLDVPKNGVRPTSAIKREAIFSILESYASKNQYDLYKNNCFLDLFAGSGSFGLEAISRGASFSYFFEINNNIKEVLLINCKKICKKNQFNIYQQDSTSLDNKNFFYPVSVIFIDPPYKLNPFNNLLNQFIKQNILNDKTIIVIEANKKTSIELDKEFIIIKEKQYGKTKIIFLKKKLG
jgi:16S rRNA (guanine966-N2)-methyltransferase